MQYEKFDHQPTDRLPENLQSLADPKQPLSDAVKAAYEPPAHEKLNMARIGLIFTLSIGILGVLFALVINRQQVGFYAMVLALCTIILIWVLKQYRAHAAAGGDSQRLGVYVLPEGIVHITADKDGKRFVSFLPREFVTGFTFEDEADDYAHTVIAVKTEEGDWTEYTFPSVGMLHPWHRQQLEHWLSEGIFCWENYKRPKNSQGE